MTPWQIAKPGCTEFSEQVALMAWCAMAKNRGFDAAWNAVSYTTPNNSPFEAIPEIARVFAVKNAGHGDQIRGARAKAEGVRKGVPDLFWPFVYHDFGTVIPGLWIELKRPKKGRVDGKQDEWHDYLRGQWYRVVVAYGWEHAARAIQHYYEHGTELPA